MPEEQNVRGSIWHEQFNRFLSTVWQWTQLGDSSTDVPDPQRDRWRDRGLDSVFYYRNNSAAYQQVVLVDAKTVDKMGNLRKDHVQSWVTELLSKVDDLPLAREFQEKYHPEMSAQYHLGLIGLWVRDVETYSSPKLQSWLSQIYVPRKRTPCTVGLIANQAIAEWCAIHEEVEKLKLSGECQTVTYCFPDYGRKPSADGVSVPYEAGFSRFAFFRATMLQTVMGSTYRSPYKANIVFYLGDIRDYDDLRFVGLALKQFQMLHASELVVYTLRDLADIRNQIRTFKMEFSLAPGPDEEATDQGVAGDNIKFRQLVVDSHLPRILLNDK